MINAQGLITSAVYIALTSLAVRPFQCIANPDGTSSMSNYRTWTARFASPSSYSFLAVNRERLHNHKTIIKPLLNPTIFMFFILIYMDTYMRYIINI